MIKNPELLKTEIKVGKKLVIIASVVLILVQIISTVYSYFQHIYLNEPQELNAPALIVFILILGVVIFVMFNGFKFYIAIVSAYFLLYSVLFVMILTQLITKPFETQGMQIYGLISGAVCLLGYLFCFYTVTFSKPVKAYYKSNRVKKTDL